LFGNFILITVFLNVLTLAADSMVTSDDGSNLLALLNQVFTYIFIIEMGLKVFAMGIIDYVSDKMNLFDALIVSISIIEMAVLTGPNKAASAFRAVRLFRTFRVLRVTKLLRSLAYMKIIMGVISRSISKMAWIFLLMILFLYIYSLLGMQFFGGNLEFRDNVGDDRVRQNYDNFVNAFMASFQVMTQENWNTILDLALRSPDVNNFLAIIYLVSWLCIGNWVFLNLLLATILDEFTNEDAKQDEKELKDEEEEIAEAENKEATGILGATTKSPFAHTVVGGNTPNTSGNMLMSQKSINRSNTQALRAKQNEVFMDFEDDEEDDNAVKVKPPFDYSMKEIKCKRSLYVLSKFNPFRKIAYRIVKDNHFEHAIFFAIFVSSMKLAIDTYIADDSPAGTVSGYIDYGINGFFILESILKIVTFGFFLDKRSYLRDSWSILDFFIVSASIMDMSLTSVKLNFIKVRKVLLINV
jgi:Ion transport protein